MIRLSETPHLQEPTTAVRTSYLVGEQADLLLRGTDTSSLAAASEDFGQYVAERRGIVERWGVPSEVFWFVSGEMYLGSLVLRHRLTEDEGGGHIGYHVVQPWQRQGHATRMLGEALVKAKDLGLERVLLTVAPDNVASLRVVHRHGGVPDGRNHEGEDRYWVETAPL
ncbi:GNAT family N-acetyltransferase [Aeromicrobium sp. CTD01-1L150]|uniref:GNAT family N-acetyltransferase n=1 Tax=Aeromicrobium sp. CTD01-1L150 TaxID=3341830 RepID=UPI0035C1D26C